MRAKALCGESRMKNRINEVISAFLDDMSILVAISQITSWAGIMRGDNSELKCMYVN